MQPQCVLAGEDILMRPIHVAAFVLPFVLSTAAVAQSNWDKTYNVSGKAALQIEVDDASMKVQTCSGCRTVRIHVDGKGSDLNRFRIVEMQGGDGIHFSMKQKTEIRTFGGWHSRSPEITIETPAETTLQARAGDGSIAVAGLHGDVDVRTGDGSIAADDVSGALHLTTGDGSIQLHRAEGTLLATTGDGSISAEGRFSQVEARSGDGSIQLALLPGSKLAASSRIASGDGSIALTVPRDLQAEITASAGSGNVANGLPLQMTTSTGRRMVHGTMNGGGPSLRLQAGDGSIAMTTR
jgi:hypothetical protein